MATMLTGQAGRAEDALRGRKRRLDDEIDAAENPKEKPKAEPAKEPPAPARPPMSRKW